MFCSYIDEIWLSLTGRTQRHVTDLLVKYAHV